MQRQSESGLELLIGSTLAMWAVYFIDLITPGHIGHGIVPRTTYGLYGIVMAPFLHANLQHLIANTIPFVLLGSLIVLRGARALMFVMLTSAAVAGLGTWLFGAPMTNHIGASGVVFGFFGYVLLRGLYDKRFSSILIGLIIAALYGASLIMSLVPVAGISWTGHVFGFIGGVMSARLRYQR